MRELTAEDLAEKEQRAQEEREAALERAEEKRRRLQAEQVSLICMGHAIEFLTSPYPLQDTHTCNHRPTPQIHKKLILLPNFDQHRKPSANGLDLSDSD